MAWTRGPTVGRGSTATVSIAAAAGGEIFAVKSADLASAALLRKEESFISQLSSPYVIRCFGSDVTSEGGGSVFNLFLEYSGGGSLSDLIRSRGGSLEEEAIRFYSQQLLVGLEYLHRNRLVHCDIKGQNVLIGGGGVKIADFGCAKWAGSGGAFAGTPAYMAPEVARGEEQGFPADVWAVGCTVVEMATGSHPWPEMKDPAAALYRIAFSGDVPETPSWFSDNAKDFLAKCLEREPEKRWTAAELLQHPFLDSAAEKSSAGEVTRRSPTSVTDQSFWDAMEVSESIEIPAEITPPPSDSPLSRIQSLIGGGSPTAEEEDWLTVRTTEIEECEDSNQNSEDSIEEEGSPTSDSALMEDHPCFNFIDGDSNCTSPSQILSVNHFTYLELIELLFLHQDQVFPISTLNLFSVNIILLIINHTVKTHILKKYKILNKSWFVNVELTSD